MRFRIIFGCSIIMVGAIIPLQAIAQSLFDRLVMPGQLIEGHAKYEKDCNNCHEPFSKSSQTKLCAACHKDIAADQQQKHGFHGLRPDTAGVDCKHCHTDHKGRSADVVAFDRETFNHKFTDFELKGAHKTAACESCHEPKAKFRKAPGQCFDCHKKLDPHKGNLGEKCGSCHEEQTWRRVKPYDHAKTKFPLNGAHEKVACNACHAGEHYKNVTTVCANCHQLQDVHVGKYGDKCETCHQSTKWSAIRFDHEKQTKFPRRGAHAKVKCEACHTSNIKQDKLATTCVSCHKKQDPHRGQLGTDCAHCHNENNWREKVAFDHELTHFPLVGLHAVVPCEECHRTTSFKDTSTKCVTCHKDTHHEGRLGTSCAYCHNPNGWKFWRFDHTKQAKYPLTGAHQGLSCHLCHRDKHVAEKFSAETLETPKLKQSTACYACHVADDIHQGNFGTACDKCHTTKTFSSGGVR